MDVSRQRPGGQHPNLRLDGLSIDAAKEPQPKQGAPAPQRAGQSCYHSDSDQQNVHDPTIAMGTSHRAANRPAARRRGMKEQLMARSGTDNRW